MPPAGETATPTTSTPAPAATTTTAPAPSGAPEAYAFKPPQGQTFNDTVMKTYGDAARKLNLTQDGAQSLLDQLGPVLQAEGSKQLAQQGDALRAQWLKDSQADKEFGGAGLEANKQVMATAMAKWGTPELSKFLNETGLGNHPELIRLMVRVGKAISPDSVVTRVLANGEGRSEPSDQQVLDKLYPSQKK
jgi:hypothetical protein